MIKGGIKIMNKPMYNGNSEMENANLIINLLNYAKKKMVVELRKEVNQLTPSGKSLTYDELHGDIYENFYDHPAFKRYLRYIEEFYTEEDW